MNKRTNIKGKRGTTIPVTPMYQKQKRKVDVRKEVVSQLNKDILKDMVKDIRKKVVEEDRSEEIHYTTVIGIYDYSDGLTFPTIENFRTKFPVGTDVEIIVKRRSRKAK